ncbi:MAG: putative heat shock protein HspR [Chloroflexi bacterium ADurb.Bin180]|jgi:MerR family transcriptional regulator/heat shock protein HspR|nr:MAG: putative heat shock protein HspR [Chloroflexi bacterium ADurb.Bin180]HOU22749.1 helix-turn-helix transcriptional regulator [Anaerolineae bacterium]HQJ52237.1 helix-turn-helix transcriptional regulator [Anaerolineae bacterium]
MNRPAATEPWFSIGVVARMVNLHPQTLRLYERVGLIAPARSPGNVRLYSESDVERLHKICRLTDELGVNLAAVEVIMRLTDTIEQLQREIETMKAMCEEWKRPGRSGEVTPNTGEEAQ